MLSVRPDVLRVRALLSYIRREEWRNEILTWVLVVVTAVIAGTALAILTMVFQ